MIRMSDVFISYSRTDGFFVRKLHDALKERNRECWVDWSDIPPTVDWREEIFDGIGAADNFVFVISPESVSSPVCRDEVRHAHSSGKRLIPIVYQEVDSALVPPELARFNFISFRTAEDFNGAFEQLLNSLDTDFQWKRSQTRFLLRAAEWKKHDRDASFLMRGKELADAESWRDSKPVDKPPTPGDSNAAVSLDSGINATSELAEFIEYSIRARTESREAEMKASKALSKVEIEEQERSRKIRRMATTKHLLLGPLPAAMFFSVSDIENFSGSTAPCVILGGILLSMMVSWMYLVSERCFGNGTAVRAVRAEVGPRASAFVALAFTWDYLLLGAVYLGCAWNYLGYVAFEYWRNHMASPTNYNVMIVSFSIFSGITLILAIARRRKPGALWVNAFTAVTAGWAVWVFYSALVKGLHFPPIYTGSNFHFAAERFRVVRPGPVLETLGYFAPFAASLYLLTNENELYRNRSIDQASGLPAARWQLIRSLFLRAIFPILAAFSVSMLVPDYPRNRMYSAVPMLGGAMYMAGPQLSRILFASLVGVTAVTASAIACAVMTKSAWAALEDALEPIGLKALFATVPAAPRRRKIVWASFILLEMGLLAMAQGNIQQLIDLFSFGYGSACVLKGASILLFVIRKHDPPQAGLESGPRIRGGTALLVAMLTVLMFVLLIVGLLTRKAMIAVPVLCGFAFSVLLVGNQFRSRLKRQTGAVEIG
jgi:hypothetical protein